MGTVCIFNERNGEKFVIQKLETEYGVFLPGISTDCRVR